MPELLCFSDAKIGLQGTVYFIGYIFGSLVWLRLTDYWGRKWMILGGLILLILTLSVWLIKMSVVTIYVCLFFLGLLYPLSIISYMLLIESVSPDYRALAGTAINLLDSLSSIYLPLIYQFGLSWWIVYWISFGLSVFSLFPLLFFIRESPKFYVSVGKFSKAREVYQFIAKLNKKPMFSQVLEGEINPVPVDGNNSRGLRELVGVRELRTNLAVLLLNWFVVCFI